MIFIKKTTPEKLKDYFIEHNYEADEESEAFILADENEIRAVCTYVLRKNYILIKKIICPSENGIFIDAVIRAMLSSKFDEEYIYAVISPENKLINDTLIKMTQFKPIFPDYEYTRGVLFDESDMDEKSIFVDIFKLFIHHECKKAIR